MTVYEKRDLGDGLTLELHYDEDAESPRDWDNAGTMVCAHRRYNLGDVQVSNPDEVLGHILSQDGVTGVCGHDLPVTWDGSDFLHADTFESVCDSSYRDIELSGVTILPLYLLDHSGLALRNTDFNDPWDSGQIGLIYLTDLKAKQEGITDAEGCLRSETEEYGMYLSGEVYGYVLERDGETLDSCWGFIGSDHFESELPKAEDYPREVSA